MNEIQLKIDNVKAGFESYGYWVASHPIEGRENEYYAELLAELKKLDKRADAIRKYWNCRGNSKRFIRILHCEIPEPCWGVHISKLNN